MTIKVFLTVVVIFIAFSHAFSRTVVRPIESPATDNEDTDSFYPKVTLLLPSDKPYTDFDIAVAAEFGEDIDSSPLKLEEQSREDSETVLVDKIVDQDHNTLPSSFVTFRPRTHGFHPQNIGGDPFRVPRNFKTRHHHLHRRTQFDRFDSDLNREQKQDDNDNDNDNDDDEMLNGLNEKREREGRPRVFRFPLRPSVEVMRGNEEIKKLIALVREASNSGGVVVPDENKEHNAGGFVKRIRKFFNEF